MCPTSFFDIKNRCPTQHDVTSTSKESSWKVFFNAKKGLFFKSHLLGENTNHHQSPATLAPMSFSWRGSYKPCASGMASKPLYCDLQGASFLGNFGEKKHVFLVGNEEEKKRLAILEELEFWGSFFFCHYGILRSEMIFWADTNLMI